jgi:hypothetical protein
MFRTRVMDCDTIQHDDRIVGCTDATIGSVFCGKSFDFCTLCQDADSGQPKELRVQR